MCDSYFDIKLIAEMLGQISAVYSTLQNKGEKSY